METHKRTLNFNEVHLYWVNLSSYTSQLADFKALLNAEESERAARFHTSLLQNRFILARAWLRKLLAKYLQKSAAEVVFTYGEHGKPHIAEPLEFSVAHTENYAAYAFSRNMVLGIDLESLNREVDYLEITERFFSPIEFEILKALSASEQRTGFFRIWTAKEAIGKALGLGLNYPLAHCSIEADPHKPLQILSFESEIFKNWCLYEFQPFSDCTAALAVVSKPVNLISVQTFVF